MLNFQIWMNSATRDIESRDTFEMILKHISDFLKDSSFQDAAKEIVCSVLEGMVVDIVVNRTLIRVITVFTYLNFFFLISFLIHVQGLSAEFPDSESELYEIYLDAITEMPMANLEKISNPVLWWEVSPAESLHSFREIEDNSQLKRLKTTVEQCQSHF